MHVVRDVALFLSLPTRIQMLGSRGRGLRVHHVTVRRPSHRRHSKLLLEQLLGSINQPLTLLEAVRRLAHPLRDNGKPLIKLSRRLVQAVVQLEVLRVPRATWIQRMLDLLLGRAIQAHVMALTHRQIVSVVLVLLQL